MTIEAMVPDALPSTSKPDSAASGFEMVGLNFDDRFKIFYKNMDKVRRLLKGETVDTAYLAPWKEHIDGPRFVLTAWASELSLKRAIKEFDGWMTSCWNANFNTMADGIKGDRDLGGKRAMATTCRIDLTQPTKKASDDEPFMLFCDPTEAAERINRMVRSVTTILSILSRWPRSQLHRGRSRADSFITAKGRPQALRQLIGVQEMGDHVPIRQAIRSQGN